MSVVVVTTEKAEQPPPSRPQTQAPEDSPESPLSASPRAPGPRGEEQPHVYFLSRRRTGRPVQWKEPVEASGFCRAGTSVLR